LLIKNRQRREAMASMKLKTWAMVAIAAVCMTFILLPRICWADGGECQIEYQTGDTFVTAEILKTYTAAAELITHILENRYSYPVPPMQEILNTCIDGCCHSSFSDDSRTITVSACTDGWATEGFMSTGGSSGGGGAIAVFKWKVLCCENDSDCDDLEVCVDSICVEATSAECVDDSDCDDLEVCVYDRCVAIPVECEDDNDCDMVLNDYDLCPMTLEAEIVDPDGCSLDQLCPCDGPMDSIKAWRNHGKYVSCVSKQSEGFFEMSLISEFEQDAIVDEAAESECGNKK
jgi:hypothetical protein